VEDDPVESSDATDGDDQPRLAKGTARRTGMTGEPTEPLLLTIET
jgi:hypothetical protein